jgi:hypothetical protein
MADFKEELKNFVITDEDRKRLSPAEIARLEALVKELREKDSGSTTFSDPKKFDAKSMQPVGKGPVNWKKPRR